MDPPQLDPNLEEADKAPVKPEKTSTDVEEAVGLGRVSELLAKGESSTSLR